MAKTKVTCSVEGKVVVLSLPIKGAKALGYMLEAVADTMDCVSAHEIGVSAAEHAAAMAAFGEVYSALQGIEEGS